MRNLNAQNRNTEISEPFQSQDYAHLKGSSWISVDSTFTKCFSCNKGRFLLIKINIFKLLFAFWHTRMRVILSY